MNNSDSALQEYLTLRDRASSAHLATLSSNDSPEASYAPCVWYRADCYLFLSDLASHTGNLMRNPEIGLMLIETESDNPFARRRITLRGSARVIARDNDLFKLVLAEFQHRFGKVMKTIEPLPDFRLFCIRPRSGRFIRGFGQAYELAGDKLDRLSHINPG